MRDFFIIATFGKRRGIKNINFYFNKRKTAKLFAKIFLDHNPLCSRYTIYEKS